MPAFKNTAFTPAHDIVAEITGSGAPNPGFTGAATVGAGLTPTYAASIELAPFLQVTRCIIIVTTAGIGNATLTAAFVPAAGAILRIQVNNDAGAGRTITFSTGFRFTAATLVGTASKIMTIMFQSDGTTWNELSRTIAMT